MNLEGRVSVVTGAAGHVGKVFCETLAEMGSSVVLVDVAAPQCHAVSTEIADRFGVPTLPLIVDLENEDQIRAIPSLVAERFGQIDILVNNAAFVGTSDLKGWATAFSEQGLDSWRRAMEVNLTSVFLLSQICSDLLRISKKGSIINIGSIYGIVGPDLSLYAGTSMGNPAAYAASKGGLLQFTRWLATVLAPDIRVNAITPGGIWRGQSEQFVARYLERTPLQRMATEEDLKGALAFLASDMSTYVTGHNLVVDGGWTIW